MKIEDLSSLPINDSGGLMDCFGNIKDPRSKWGKRHSLATILAITFCAILSGADSYPSIVVWMKSIPKEMYPMFAIGTHGLPSLSIIQKTLRILDMEQFENCITEWILTNRSFLEKYIAIDGKTIRGSKINPEDEAIHLISAIIHKEKIIITQKKVDGKTNEIPVAKEMLIDIDIKGSVITADAMHTQEDTARIIVKEKEADYIFMVKGNQKNLLHSLMNLDYKNNSETLTTTDKEHGRIEIRTMSIIENKNEYHLSFPFIEQIFQLERQRCDLSGEILSTEKVYGITSLSKTSADVKKIMEGVRGHWCIENAEHYIRDVVFGEDKSTTRDGSCPQVMATFRNLAMNIMRMVGWNSIAQGRNFFAFGNKKFVTRVLGRAF